MRNTNSSTNSKERLKQANKTTGIGAIFNIVLSLTKIITGILLSLFIIKEAFHIGKISINELLEIALPREIQNQILQVASSTQGVYNPHNLKTRRIGNISAVDLHILIDSNTTVENGHNIAHKVESAVKEELGDDMI